MTMVSNSMTATDCAAATTFRKSRGPGSDATDQPAFGTLIGDSKRLSQGGSPAKPIGNISGQETSEASACREQEKQIAAQRDTRHEKDAVELTSTSATPVGSPIPLLRPSQCQLANSPEPGNPIVKNGDGADRTKGAAAPIFGFAAPDGTSERSHDHLLAFERFATAQELPKVPHTPRFGSKSDSGVRPGGVHIGWISNETHLIAASPHSMFSDKIASIGSDVEYRAAPIGAGTPIATDGKLQASPQLASSSHPIPLFTQIADHVFAALHLGQSGTQEAATAEAIPLSQPIHELTPASGSGAVKALRLGLNPGELGEVQIRLTLKQDKVQLHLSFSAESAANVARSDGRALMQAIADGGLILSHLLIDVAQTSSPSASPRSAESGLGTGGGALADSGAGRQQGEQGEQSRRLPVRSPASDEKRLRTGVFI